MRVAANQLVADGAGNALEVELPRLAGHLRMKHHLEQQISQFILEMLRVAALDGIRHLVGLLDGVRRNAGKGLLPIPGAAVGGSQPRHDGEQFLQPIARHARAGHRGPAPRACSMRRNVSSMPAVAPQMLRLP